MIKVIFIILILVVSVFANVGCNFYTEAVCQKFTSISVECLYKECAPDVFQYNSKCVYFKTMPTKHNIYAGLVVLTAAEYRAREICITPSEMTVFTSCDYSDVDMRHF